MKPKQNDKPQHLQELTGSPSPTAVSDVAKGGKPQTLAEFDAEYQALNTGARNGDISQVKGMGSVAGDCDEIEEAYAVLFKGLSMVAAAHVNEEHQEEGESENSDTSSEDNSKQSCDCCGDKCDCGDCSSC